MVQRILLLGNPLLYKKAAPVTEADAPLLLEWMQDLRDTLLDYRCRYGAGRAIAAPQIGIRRRIIYQQSNGAETVYINPTLTFPDEDTQQVMDDCMSFPGLLVALTRYRRCQVDYLDHSMRPHTVLLEGDLAELLQHEADHLDGILAPMRAEGPRALHMLGWDA